MTCYLLPGMGATSQMYQDQWHNLDDCTFLDWPAYQNEQTFTELAQRIITQHKLSSHDVIGGSSLGGMVALEIAALIKAPACILIGSAMCPKEINLLLRLISPLSSITPISLTQLLAGKSSGILGDMYKQSDPTFIRAMCKHINNWEPSNYPSNQIHRIHGTQDHIIPLPDDAYSIEKAGHLIAMTHKKECCDWLTELLHESI